MTLPLTTKQVIDGRRLRSYGRNVKRRRVEAGMTQAKLGKLVDVGVVQISNIENGVNWSSMPVYRRICEVLEVGLPPLMQ